MNDKSASSSQNQKDHEKKNLIKSIASGQSQEKTKEAEKEENDDRDFDAFHRFFTKFVFEAVIPFLKSIFLISFFFLGCKAWQSTPNHDA
ncbi:MAG: hypothetical protein JJU05_02105 [Verrucomicrobia bacterium]|nr:hypothetical protein [Verrucomicrobiota bacterium]MCH8526203.1 hypothetical protein [Kiritimatiellia bacterium]